MDGDRHCRARRRILHRRHADNEGQLACGHPGEEGDSLVKGDIYRIIRNPAFVGFDLMYIGILLAFPNAWHAPVSITLMLFHKQILSEEQFPEGAFGEEYADYKKKSEGIFKR